MQKDAVFILFTRDGAVDKVTQDVLSALWCHLSCGALVRKLGDEGKMVLNLTEKVKVKQQDDGSWHYQMFF